jgi:hypothetical protein
VLTGLGFDAPLPPGSTLPSRHLPGATLRAEGLVVQVEVHHRLLSNYFDDVVSYARASILPARRGPRPQKERSGMIAATIAPQSFVLDGMTAYTLSYEDTLQHLCRHLTSHVNVWDFCRLIWVADVVSLAEKFGPQIDWARVRRQCPEVLDVLSLFHCMTPLSDELLDQSGVEIGRAPEGIGVEYRGWPRPATERRQGWRRVLRDTLVPSEWWLRLRYKLGSTRPLFWSRWVRHPLYVLGHVARAILERLGWPAPLELAGRRAPGQTNRP